MFSTLVAISGMLAAAPAAAPRSAPVDSVELSFVTHAGEGAAGVKRFARSGCYQGEWSGGTGGGHARDSEAGCHRPTDVEPVFTRLAGLAAEALTRETKSLAAAAPGAPGLRSEPGASQTQVVLIRPDGSRWVAANRTAADDILRAVNDLPGESQWYAPPPATPIGKGAQLLVLSVAVSKEGGRSRLEAALIGDGRWWCHRTVEAAPGARTQLPAKNAPPLADAPARLGRILAGARAAAGDDTQAEDGKSDKKGDGTETSVEVVWPGKERARLSPWRLRSSVAERFAAEMRALSPACAAR